MAFAGNRTLYILTGATAVGKTEWALRWALENDAEIVSCDSLLFYRGMDIGTAKPSAEELARVPHHLIDLLEVDEPMNIARYAALAKAAVEAIAGRGKRVLITGGSGFYLKSFFAATSVKIQVSPEFRAQVAGIEAASGLGGLLERLEGLNPQGLGSLDSENPRRVVRALERCLASGLTLSQLQTAFAALPAPFADWSLRLVRLDRPIEALERRIEQRVRGMLAAGLVEEVKRLLERGLASNPSASKAIGYRDGIEVSKTGAPAETLLPVISPTRALS